MTITLTWSMLIWVVPTIIWLVLCAIIIRLNTNESHGGGMFAPIGDAVAGLMAGFGCLLVTVFYAIFWIVYLLCTRGQ